MQLTMIINELLHIMHNLEIPLVCIFGHFSEEVLAIAIGRCRLGMQDEWYSKKALDPFDELVPPMGLESI